MTDKNYTHVTVVVDRSGSMSSVKTDAEGGLNNLIAEQKKVPGRMTLTLVEFDDVYNVVYDNVDVQNVGYYSLIPRGMTALLDAVGKAINVTGDRLKALPEDERPGKVLVVIVTDGGENASREFTADKIKELVKHQEDVYNWDFTFIGSNIDAFATGTQFGFRSNIQYAGTGVSNRSMYSGLTQSLTNTRLSVANDEADVSLASFMDSDYSE